MSLLIAGCFADCEWQSTTSAFQHLSEMVAVGCLSKVVALWSLLNISARVAVTVEAVPHIAGKVTGTVSVAVCIRSTTTVYHFTQL